MVPYNGGAFLPDEQRYTSPIFRRLHRIDRAEWLNLNEAAELVAVIRLTNELVATRMFQWTQARRMQARRLVQHVPVWEASEAFHQANLVALSEEDGDAALRAMKAGGWKGGKLPDFIRRSLQARRKRGETTQQMADAYGITLSTMYTMITPRPPKKHAWGQSAALLAVG